MEIGDDGWARDLSLRPARRLYFFSRGPRDGTRGPSEGREACELGRACGPPPPPAVANLRHEGFSRGGYRGGVLASPRSTPLAGTWRGAAILAFHLHHTEPNLQWGSRERGGLFHDRLSRPDAKDQASTDLLGVHFQNNHGGRSGARIHLGRLGATRAKKQNKAIAVKNLSALRFGPAGAETGVIVPPGSMKLVETSNEDVGQRGPTLLAIKTGAKLPGALQSRAIFFRGTRKARTYSIGFDGRAGGAETAAPNTQNMVDRMGRRGGRRTEWKTVRLTELCGKKQTSWCGGLFARRPVFFLLWDSGWAAAADNPQKPRRAYLARVVSGPGKGAELTRRAGR